MIFFIKMTLSFIFCFLVLSYPVSDKTVFNYLHKMTHPFTQKIFQKIKRNIDQSSRWSSKLFSNSNPNRTSYPYPQNTIQKKKFAIEYEIQQDSILERYTSEEKEFLKKIIERKE